MQREIVHVFREKKTIGFLKQFHLLSISILLQKFQESAISEQSSHLIVPVGTVPYFKFLYVGQMSEKSKVRTRDIF